MFARRYFAGRYFPPRYFPQSQGEAPVVSGDLGELLYAALGPLVSTRAYPNVFPQRPGRPAWPAIRYAFDDVDAAPDLCGDGDADDTRVSFEIAAESYGAMRSLRAQVMTALRSFAIPALWQGETRRYDPVAKTCNCSLDYQFYASSGTGSYAAPDLGDAADYVNTIEDDLYAALQGLVGGRCFPMVFPQQAQRPQWPAARYTVVSATAAPDLCGDGGDGAVDLRIQIDLVAEGYTAVKTLRNQVAAALQAFDPPALRDGERDDYDAEAKAHIRSMDFLFYPSVGHA